MGYAGRFAPSPTGALHLGNARTALLAWLDARAHEGKFILRMEDIDSARTVPGMAAQQLDELRWLGLDWDEGPDVGGPNGPYTQSECIPIYEAALDTLRRHQRVYPCICSRKDLQRLASAPHIGEEGPPYPGTCRGRFSSEEDAIKAAGRPVSIRFQVPDSVVTVQDVLHGAYSQQLAREVGDVVIRRADGVFAYQLAVTVDDGRMGVTHVVRAEDLLPSAPRQRALLEAMGYPAPVYAHVPMLAGPDGQRLQKRLPQHTLAGLRGAGVRPESVVGWLAHSAGLVGDPGPVTARSLIGGFDWKALRNAPDWSRVPSP